MRARYEYKYLVPNHLIDLLRKDILKYMKLDEFAQKYKNGQYTVRSIYYDTKNFDCYKEKLDGVKIRNKFRIRGYNEPTEKSVTFLEIKHKDTNCISKSRAPLYFNNLSRLLNARRVDDYILSFSGNGVEKKDARKFLYYYYGKKLHPAVLIIYDREAFQGIFDSSLRITFDKNLRSAIYPSLNQLYDDSKVKVVMKNNFILEVKFFGTLPRWIKSVISKYDLQKKALSKYTMSLEAHKDFSMNQLIKSKLISNREICYAE